MLKKTFWTSIFILVLFSFLASAQIIDGSINTSEWPSDSYFNVNETDWYLSSNTNKFQIGWKTYRNASAYESTCFWTNQPENNRQSKTPTAGCPVSYTLISGHSITLPFQAIMRVQCTDQNCTQSTWDTVAWVQLDTVGYCSTPSQCEYDVNNVDIVSSNGITFVFCVSEFDNDTNSISTVIFGSEIGLPLQTVNQVTGSNWPGWWNTFPSVTNSSGVWNDTVALWGPGAAPSNDSTVVIDHAVTLSSYSTEIRNLYIAGGASLNIATEAILTVGGWLEDAKWIPAEVQINGTLITSNGTLVVKTPTNINCAQPVQFDHLVLAGTDEASFVGEPFTVGTLEITENATIQGVTQIVYSQPKSLVYSGTTNRGVEWPQALNSSSQSVPSSVTLSSKTTVHSKITADLWVNSLDIQGKLELSSDFPNRTLHVQTLSISNGLSMNHTVMVDEYNCTLNGGCFIKCGNNGQFLYSNGSTVNTFYITMIEETGSNILKSYTRYFEAETHSDFSLELKYDFVAQSWWFLDNVSIRNDTNLVQFTQDSGTIVVSMKLASTQDCIATKTIKFQRVKQPEGVPRFVAYIIAAVILLVIIGAVVFVVMKIRRKKKQKEEHIEQPQADVEMNPLEISNSSISPEPLRSDWQIDYNSITISKELGRGTFYKSHGSKIPGAFGVVYKCRWRNTDCVVKQLDINKKDDHAVKLFLKEAHNVQKLRPHPNVCLVLGVCVNPEYPICIVMEFLSQGSLDNLLYNRIITMDAKRLLAFGKDIASGMSHLHAENVLHCDLACRNILVDVKGGEYILKIADFGLSRQTEESEYQARDKTFPIRWTAPETLRKGIVSKGSDVWSFGVVLWEMMEAQQPYPGMTNAQVISAVCDQGYRLPKPSHMPEEVFELMLRCWDNTSSNRPSFDDIFKELSRMRENVPQPNIINNEAVYGNADVDNNYQTQ